MNDTRQNLEDVLWYYLYSEGIIKMPLVWHYGLVRYRIGMFVLSIIVPIVDIVTRSWNCEQHTAKS